MSHVKNAPRLLDKCPSKFLRKSATRWPSKCPRRYAAKKKSENATTSPAMCLESNASK